MKQAGDAIKTNTDLKMIDEAWETNAYLEIKHAKKNQPTFLDPAIESQMWKMKTGELSQVLTGKSISMVGEEEAYYKVIKINTREDKQYDSYDEFIKSQ